MSKSFFVSILFSILFSSGSALASTGKYIVPTTPEFEDINTFDVEGLEFTRDRRGVRSVAFVLPKDLVGLELMPMTFERERMSGKLLGDFGEMNCQRESRSKFSCHVDFNDLYKDVLEALDPLIEERMREANPDPIQFARMKSLWESFAGDPLGFLVFSTY